MTIPGRLPHAITALFACATLAACGAGDGDSTGEPALPESGRQVLEAMVDAHADSRYRTLTFVQRTVAFGADGTAPDTSTWYEALAPNRLRIDVSPWREGNGILYRDGMRYRIRDGTVVDSARDTNPLALILADAFHQEVDRTVAELDSLGFELGTVRADRWNGRAVWVVGAAPGDTTSSQFWIETERRLPVRVIHPLDSGPTLDAHVGGYRQIDGSWVETTIAIHVGGRLAQDELYDRIRVDPALPEGLFDPYDWTIQEPYWE